MQIKRATFVALFSKTADLFPHIRLFKTLKYTKYVVGLERRICEKISRCVKLEDADLFPHIRLIKTSKYTKYVVGLERRIC